MGPVNVPDVQAYATGRILAERLAAHGDFRRAYEESKPAGNQTYVYLSAYRVQVAAPPVAPGDLAVLLDQWGETLQTQLSGLGERVSELEHALRGRMQVLENQYRFNEAQLRQDMALNYHGRLTRMQALRWLTGYLLFGVLLLLAAGAWVRLRWQWSEAFLIAVGVYVVAAHLFISGLGFTWRKRKKPEVKPDE